MLAIVRGQTPFTTRLMGSDPHPQVDSWGQTPIHGSTQGVESDRVGGSDPIARDDSRLQEFNGGQRRGIAVSATLAALQIDFLPRSEAPRGGFLLATEGARAATAPHLHSRYESPRH